MSQSWEDDLVQFFVLPSPRLVEIHSLQAAQRSYNYRFLPLPRFLFFSEGWPNPYLAYQVAGPQVPLQAMTSEEGDYPGHKSPAPRPLQGAMIGLHDQPRTRCYFKPTPAHLMLEFLNPLVFSPTVCYR